jgi:secreted PhoX family phosphatase
MRIIVTDKLARRHRNLSGMIEIEMPCCGTTTLVEELTDSVGCETCGVVLELDSPATEALPVAA